MVKKSKRWTEEDLKKTTVGVARGGGKTGRYGNVNKIEHDGIRFDSKREFLRYCDLKLLEAAGEIRHLEVHPKFEIVIGGVPIMTNSNQHMKWDKPLTYEADFKYEEWQAPWWPVVIEDVKMQSGHRTGIYKIKRALMRAMGHDIEEY